MILEDGRSDDYMRMSKIEREINLDLVYGVVISRIIPSISNVI